MSDEKNDVSRGLRKLDSQSKARTDLELIKLRGIHDRMQEDERQETIRYLSAVLELAEPQVAVLIKLTVTIAEGGEEGEKVEMSPLAALKAFQAWGRGELYTPTAIAELF